jgi:LytS/YehU family sensor histidine kinase
MPQLQHEHATLADEENLVRAYLELMQMRMPDRLAFDVDVDPQLRPMRFPPMALLTLVENAIHHGVDPNVEASRVEVRARRGDGRVLRIAVSDTGVGMSEKAAEGTGLTNLRARMRAFFGDAARLELSEHAPHGVVAELVIPHGA